MIQKSYFPLLLISAVFVLSLSACGAPEPAAPTVDVNEIVQQVAATLQMGYTQTAQALPTATQTPEPTATPIPSATSVPLIVASPTSAPPPIPTGPTPLPIVPATANGCYNAWFVADVTVPSGTKYDPGDAFTKTWRVLNTGTCEWTGDFKITYVGGNMFGSDSVKIRQRVGVGGTAEVSLEMFAPHLSGTAISNWQLMTADGDLFGPVLTVSILLPGGNATTTADDCLDATLISDVSIPSGTKLDIGEAFTKTWQIENSGSCAWTREFRITFVGGDVLGSDTTKIRQRVEPGATTEISLPMVVPSGSGYVSSSWQMADDSGVLFGDVFTFQIVIK